MTDRPILMSAPMVRAILAGTKTQTRRIAKIENVMGREALFARRKGPKHADTFLLPEHAQAATVCCPYGQSGDRLWVKETWRTAKSLDAKSPAAIGEMCIDAGYRKPWAPLAYEADGHRNSEWRGFELDRDAEPGKTRVSIHMPRWASRITLELTGVRVERLQDISYPDARAEGTPCYVCGGPLNGKSEDDCDCFHRHATPSDYRFVWEQINGPGSWDLNPWVWVVEFKRVPPLAQGPEERKQ